MKLKTLCVSTQYVQRPVVAVLGARGKSNFPTFSSSQRVL